MIAKEEKNMSNTNAAAASGELGAQLNERSATKVQDMTVLAFFTAIILLMSYTPLGLIDLPLIKATILHVPVIIGAVILGPKRGAFLGFVFGFVSLIKNSMAPSLLSFAFTPLVPVPGTGHGSIWAVVIAIVPRMLIGVTSYFVYAGIRKLAAGKFNFGVRTVALTLSGVVGALTNTALVMGLIYVLFKEAFATAKDIPVDAVRDVILGIVAANGIPEAICAAVIVPLVVTALLKVDLVRKMAK